MISERERRLIAALGDALDGMEDMIGYVPEYFQEKWGHREYIDRAEAVLAEFEEGAGEPRGDSPDSPPAGEAGVPGLSGKRVPIAFAGNDPADLWENIPPLSPEEFTRDTRVDWPVIPKGYAYVSVSPFYVSVDGVSFYEKPDGTPLSEFLEQIRGFEE